MARPSKLQLEMDAKFKTNEDVVEVVPAEIEQKQIDVLVKEIEILIAKVAAIEEKMLTPRKSSINRVEVFNGEVETTPDDNRGIKMTAEDKITSMRNAAKILPPNMIENGRHIKENIQAICGFIVDEDMMDEMYTGFSHSED